MNEPRERMGKLAERYQRFAEDQNAVSFNGLILLLIRHVVLDVLSKAFASIKSGVSSPSLNLP